MTATSTIRGRTYCEGCHLWVNAGEQHFCSGDRIPAPERLERPLFAVSHTYPPESILQEAQRIVHGDRGDAYGHPIDNFTQTANLWNTTFAAKLREGAAFTAEDVALAMIQVKVSRQTHVPKRDNLVDIAGYAETHQMVTEERQRRGQGVPCA